MSDQAGLTAVETSFFQFSLAREKLEVNKEMMKEYMDIQIRSKSIDNLMENQDNIGLSNSPTNKQRCRCPIDMRERCIIKETTSCSSERALSAYAINGKEIPYSFMKNKFIVFNNMTLYPYRYIHDHTSASKNYLANITIM